MKKNKYRNPLIKRIPRELIGDWHKYVIVAIFLILTIGFVSGMYVANGSMMKAANDGVDIYNLENGHFELDEEASSDLIAAIETGTKADVKSYYIEEAQKELDEKFEDEDFVVSKVDIYENYFINATEDRDKDGVSDGNVRVFLKTDFINQACVLEGELPDSANEIAIDRMHADNTELSLGDVINVDGEEFTITGLIAYVNYSTLHENITDFMFDAITFNVAMVTDEGFDRLRSDVHYNYAWIYENQPSDDIEEKKASDDFLKALLTQTVVEDKEIESFVPRYANSAVQFALDDMGGDMSMAGVLLDILIVIIAFIFAITISNTIEKESSTIGTLRASGYTKGELVAHYISMPIIVTLFAAVVGNVLGYTAFKNLVVGMYYNSYSLPTYETVWDGNAFIKTTLIPIVLMIVINLIVIVGVMRHTPLEFLRHNLKRTKRKKAVRLPRWSFINRFRLRIILQNIPNYLILFIGILFITTMLAMAVGMPSSLKYYMDKAPDMMFSKYQYIMKDFEDEDGNIITTDNADAEIFDMTSLIKKSDAIDEEVSVYGISDDSIYVEINELSSLKDGEVVISENFAQKYGISKGDSIVLNEKYENKTYEFTVVNTYEKCMSIAIFMPKVNYDKLFDLSEGEFTGFLSNTEIADIDEGLIATIITEKDITKMMVQLDHSMGTLMSYFQYICVILSAVLIYLLTKIIIEKNENSISMTKILGYKNGEIAGLYMVSTTIVVVIADLISIFVGSFIMSYAWKVIMSTYSGYFEFTLNALDYTKMFVFVLIGYMIVMFFDFNRIKKIPMDQALKNVE